MDAEAKTDVDITKLDDAQFLELLEQDLGRRWPVMWRLRLCSLLPWAWNVREASGTASASEQQGAIDRVRSGLVAQVKYRLTR